MMFFLAQAMMFFVAQATQPVVVVTDPEWRFWFIAIIGISTLATSIIMPFILGGIRGIKERLKRGDDKFDNNANEIATLKTMVFNLVKVVEEQGRKLDQVHTTETENRIEENSQVHKLSRELERDFARKEHVDALEQKMEERHKEVMNTLYKMLGGKR